MLKNPTLDLLGFLPFRVSLGVVPLAWHRSNRRSFRRARVLMGGAIASSEKLI